MYDKVANCCIAICSNVMQVAVLHQVTRIWCPQMSGNVRFANVRNRSCSTSRAGPSGATGSGIATAAAFKQGSCNGRALSKLMKVKNTNNVNQRSRAFPPCAEGGTRGATNCDYDPMKKKIRMEHGRKTWGEHRAMTKSRLQHPPLKFNNCI